MVNEMRRKSGATVTGTVEQHRMNITSTILKVDSDKGALKALAEMQLASVELTESLIEIGCKRLGPDELAYEMGNTWVLENERLSQNLWGPYINHGRVFSTIEGTTGIAEEVQHPIDTEVWRLFET